MKEQLRLDYFLSLGLKLVEGDNYINSISQLCVVSDLFMNDLNTPREDDTVKLYITSFAQRKNTGVQPVGDDVPVMNEYEIAEGNFHPGLAGNARYEILDVEYPNIKSWKPDLEALIKMQIEHDTQAVKHVDAEVITDPVEIYNVMAGDKSELEAQVINDLMEKAVAGYQVPLSRLRGETVLSPIEGEEVVWLPVGDLNTKQCTFNKPTYTQAMKDAGESTIGMIYIDHNLDECEMIGENNSLSLFIGRLTDPAIHHRHLSVSVKGLCEPIETQTPKQKQLSDLFLWLNKQGMVHNPDDIKDMQDAGWLAECLQGSV